MKTHIYLTLLVFILVLPISGCQNETKPEVNALAKKESNTIVINAVQSDPRTSELPTKLNDFSFDLDLDKEEERIELYTAAGRGDDGKMWWDDGQKWLLVVVDRDKYYPLYSGFVQIGEVYFSVSTIGEQMVPQISVLLSTHSGISITDFVFNSEKERFEGEAVYRPKDKYQYYTSFPSY